MTRSTVFCSTVRSVRLRLPFPPRLFMCCCLLNPHVIFLSTFPLPSVLLKPNPPRPVAFSRHPVTSRLCSGQAAASQATPASPELFSNVSYAEGKPAGSNDPPVVLTATSTDKSTLVCRTLYYLCSPVGRSKCGKYISVCHPLAFATNGIQSGSTTNRRHADSDEH